MRKISAMKTLTIAGLIIVIAVGTTGCGGMRTTVFLHDAYNFQYVERLAVIPFDNVSETRGAGIRAGRLFTSELLAAEAFDVVEPGEVSRVLEKYSLVRTDQLTNEQIIGIGKELKVQGLILGSVTETSTQRSGGSTTHKVTLVVRMVDTEVGTTVWSATATAGGRGFWGSIFGSSGKSESEATRECVRKVLHTLID